MRRVTIRLVLGLMVLTSLSCSDSTSPDTKSTAPDVSGSWSLEELTEIKTCLLGPGELPGQSYQGWLVTIAQDGADVVITPDDGGADVTGRVSGGKLSFAVDYQDPQFRSTESYVLTVSTDRTSMSGTSQWTQQETGQPQCSGTRQVIMRRNVNKNCNDITGTWVMDKVSCASCPFQTIDMTLVIQMTGCFFSGAGTFKLDGAGDADPFLFGTVDGNNVDFLWSAVVTDGQAYEEYVWEFDLQRISATQITGMLKVAAATYQEFVIFRKQ